MKKWYLVVLGILLVGLGTAVFAYGPPFGDGVPPFAANQGFRGPFGDGEGFPGFTTPLGRGGFGPWSGTGPGRGFGPTQYLNLSEEQLNKMSALRDRYFQDTRDLRYALAQEQLEVRKLFTDPKIDNTTLLTKQKQVSTLRQQLINKMEQMPIEMRKILTPEQLQKLDQLPARRYGMGFGMGPGMMGRGMMGGWRLGVGAW